MDRNLQWYHADSQRNHGSCGVCYTTCSK